ncbi:MAG: hypothetical protein JWN73_60 [Betaproteobacteria bacterium]|nr:hypothetical protein [Betaproteobacteria bacterium]
MVNAMNQEDEEKAHLRQVAEAAYFKAEHEGFPPGQALRHWLEAELDLFPEEHIDVPESLAEG